VLHRPHIGTYKLATVVRGLRAQIEALGGEIRFGSRVERLELDPCTPSTVLDALAQRGCNQVLWECGPPLAAEAIKQGCVQQLAAVIAPKLLGGLAARTPLGDLGLVDVDEAQQWDGQGLERLGPDWLWQLGLPPVDELC
jgi:diaminohydroxyphosphoribosylaminopyrimidine deaminase/5-amino-6-(5-phosphoribosylamino)uracil reductase